MERSFFFIHRCNTDALEEISKSASAKDKLTGKVEKIEFSDDKSWAKATIILEPICFVKLKAITQAAIDFANTAVEIAIGLIGVMALWLGLIKVAEEAGLVKVLDDCLLRSQNVYFRMFLPIIQLSAQSL